MTDASLPQHDLRKPSRLEAWLAWLAHQKAASEARRLARLEASPVRHALLRKAAEKRARRRARNLANAATIL